MRLAKDRYGVSWQGVPAAIPRILTDADKRESERVMAAVMRMKKRDIAALERAYAGE